MNVRDAIERVMMVNAFGAKNAKPRETILKKVNELLFDDQITDRQLRNIYADMSEEYLFGSSPDDGYFVISCKADLEASLSALDHAAAAIATRKNKLFAGYEKRYGVVDRQRELIA